MIQSKKHYKGISSEESCRKFLDALARQIALFYNFTWMKDHEIQNDYPIFDNVLYAKREKKWSFRYDIDEEAVKKIPKLDIPL